MTLTIADLDDIYNWIETIPGWRVQKYLMGWDYCSNNKLVEKRDAVVRLFHTVYDKETKLIEDYTILEKSHAIMKLIISKCNTI